MDSTCLAFSNEASFVFSLQGTLQKYIDDLFKTVLAASTVPPIIKFLFDFLDHEALRYGITDPEVVHTWKCNRWGFALAFFVFSLNLGNL